MDKPIKAHLESQWAFDNYDMTKDLKIPKRGKVHDTVRNFITRILYKRDKRWRDYLEEEKRRVFRNTKEACMDVVCAEENCEGMKWFSDMKARKAYRLHREVNYNP